MSVVISTIDMQLHSDYNIITLSSASTRRETAIKLSNCNIASNNDENK